MKKDFLKTALLFLGLYNVIPVLNWLSPATMRYTFLFDLLILNPLTALVLSFLQGAGHGARAWPVLLMAAALFCPTMLLFYNLSAAVYMVLYLLVAAIGFGAGALLNRQRSRKEAAQKAESPSMGENR